MMLSRGQLQRSKRLGIHLAQRANRRQLTNKKKESTVTPAHETAAHESSAEHDALEFLAERGRAVGANLTLTERRLILKEVGLVKNNDKLCRSDWETLVARRTLLDREKITLSEFLAKSHDGRGQQLLNATALCGVAFFSLCGSHIAGTEAGFHVLGSVLVGCVTALGGGTLNALVTGATPSWVRNPNMLALTVGASLTGFYLWPLVEHYMLTQPASDIHTDTDTNSTTTTASPQEHKKVQEKEDDSSNNKTLSPVRYWLESVALGALAVTGAQQGIIKGLHPLVSSCLGVTVAFGGVLRDLMCGRDLSLGAAASTGCQSYGVASLAGASVYVALRELHVWNCAGSAPKLLHGGIPIGLRILIGFGTVFGVRAAAWQNKPDGLLLTMDESLDINRQRVESAKAWFKGSPSS